MNYVSTHTYDDQTVRWFAPDPAEQFSNPYLAMGNNTVRYIDPDGEFVIEAMMVGAMIGAMSAGFSGASNGQIMSSFLVGGATGAAYAAGGQALPAAKIAGLASKAGAAKTKVGAFLAEPFMQAGLKSGTINALSNYNYENGWSDFGFGTFADFGAGFIGGAFGVGAGSKLAGMAVGGALNVAWNAEAGISDYEVIQRFAGGALSVYAGTGKLVKGKKFLSQYELKTARTFLKYGAQSSVYDFAYTEKKYYDKRSPLDHFGMFAVGGAAGIGIGEFFTGAKYEYGSLTRVSIGAGIYGAEWSMTSLIKQYAYARYNDISYGGFYTGRSQIAKGWVSGFKWYLPSRLFLLGQ